MKEFYSREVTDPSLKELKEFASWYNERLGNYPVIVGGWAAFAYTGGLGPKDIDVVFPDNKSKAVTLAGYFASHGFEEKRRGLFEKEFVKTVKTVKTAKSGEMEVEIIVDAVSGNRFVPIESKKVRIPWSWALKHNVEHEIGGNAVIRIPELEVLLAYKLGAVLGRSLEFKSAVSPGDVQHFRSKLWKDVYDVVSLSKRVFDGGKLDELLAEAGLDAHKLEIMRLIEDNFDAEMQALAKVPSLSESKIRMFLTAGNKQ